MSFRLGMQRGIRPRKQSPKPKLEEKQIESLEPRKVMTGAFNVFVGIFQATPVGNVVYVDTARLRLSLLYTGVNHYVEAAIQE